MKKYLLLTKRFSVDGKSKWLTDDLAWELVNENNQVTVILLDLDSKYDSSFIILHKNLRLHILGFNHQKHSNFLLKHLTLCYDLFSNNRKMKKILLKERNDVVINFSIFCFFLGIVSFLKKKALVDKSIGILWDFFPIHQVEINRLKKGFFSRILYYLENREISNLDSIGFMSKKNINFFDQYHPNYKGKKFISRLWGNPILKVTKAKFPCIKTDKLNIVFGGQFAKGRGLDMLLELVNTYPDELEAINLILLGDGPLKKLIFEKKNHLISVVNKVDRETYVEIISKCDIGLVITQSGVSIPSFPSKIIDYSFVGLPVLAIVEESTDFGEFIEDTCQCGIAINIDLDRAQVLEKIKDSLLHFSVNKRSFNLYSENSKKAYKTYFSTKKIVRSIANEIL